MNKPVMMLSLTMIGALLQLGCATTTGTKRELTASELAQIKALETQVLVEKKFEVYLARGKDSSTGFLIGGVIGSMIESSAQSGADAKDTAQFQEMLGDFDCQSFVQQNLSEGLRGAKLFSTVTAVDPVVKGGDAAPNRLGLVIHQWGVMGGSLDKTQKKALVGLTSTTTLTGPVGQIIWERTDFTTGGNFHTWDDFKASPELLRKEIEQAVRRYCLRVVNEMRFAP
jgi:hypothetical protein